MRARVLVVLIIIVWLAAGGCSVSGGDPDRPASPPPDPEVLLRETLDDAFEAAGLDPADAKVERLQNPCIGAAGDEGWNISYYLVMSRGDAIDALEKVEALWTDTPDIDVYRPFSAHRMDTMASRPPLPLGAYWYTASSEFAVGGSTPCS